MNSAHHTVPSGIPPLDARLGGAVAGRVHLLSGGPGTGKSTAGLQFIREGLRLGETVAMVTAGRLVDLRTHLAHMDLDLEAPLRERRMALLRYRPGFSALLQHAVSPEQMLIDLRRLVLDVRPARLFIDTVSPVIASTPHADLTMTALADLLESVETTTLVAYSGDVSAGRGIGYDPRLEALVERAAALFHLTRLPCDGDVAVDAPASAEPRYQFHVLRVRQPVRSSAPVTYTIEAGIGLVPVKPRHAAVLPHETLSRAGNEK